MKTWRPHATDNVKKVEVGQANRNLDVGNCAQDRRQIFNLTLVAQTPKFSNRAMRLLASDWTFGTGYVARSDTPFTVLAGTDRALNGYSGNTPGTQRANQSLADVNAANQGQSFPNSPPCISWINPLAFSQPDLGTYGNMGVNNVLGPAFWEWDEAVSRQFQIREARGWRFAPKRSTSPIASGGASVERTAQPAAGLMLSTTGTSASYAMMQHRRRRRRRLRASSSSR
jgi:hypothetical protein